MRLTTEFFVAALIRRVFSSGGFAAVERKGAAEAGAVFIRQRFRDGLESLYAPAPQSMFDEGRAYDRRFELRQDRQDADGIDALIAREAKFDSDLWVLEIETDRIDGFIETVTE